MITTERTETIVTEEQRRATEAWILARTQVHLPAPQAPQQQTSGVLTNGRVVQFSKEK